MKQLILAAFTFLLLLTNAENSVAQKLTPMRSSFKVDDTTPIFHKETGARITHEEFSAIIQKNPRVNLTKEYDKYGEIAVLFYSPNGDGLVPRDPSRRVKPGQPFPEFVFTTTSKEPLGLNDLKGKVAVLYFNMVFQEPHASKETFADFEKALTASSFRSNIVPIIITHSNEEQISAFKEKVNVPYAVVPNGVNFFDKYVIMKTPSYIVVKKDGTLRAYADNLDELKQILASLK